VGCLSPVDAQRKDLIFVKTIGLEYILRNVLPKYNINIQLVKSANTNSNVAAVADIQRKFQEAKPRWL
jgi:hypothetical protein